MSETFMRDWDYKATQKSFSERIKDAISPQSPIKERIDYVCRILDIQTSRIDQIYNRLYERDRRLFEYLVNFYMRRDMSRVKVYANELAGIRKLEKVILHSKYALQAVRMRLELVKDVGDVAVTLAPALRVIGSVRSWLSGVWPEAERELSQVGNVIGNMLTEVGHPPSSQFVFEAGSEEAERILNEARIMVERELRKTFAEIPTATSEVEKTNA